MPRYRDPWKKKSKDGMKIFGKMAKTTYKVGKAVAKSSKSKSSVPQGKGCLLFLFSLVLISATLIVAGILSK
jgi:hypothetical protein